MKGSVLLNIIDRLRMGSLGTITYMFIPLLIFICSGMASAQNVSVTTTDNPVTLSGNIAGPGISIINSSQTYIGAPEAAGTFTDGSSIGLPINEGIIMTTGNALVAGRGNTDPKFGWPNGWPGDSDLDKLLELTGFTTKDASVLEFDFTANKSIVYIYYVFASEEYNDFVGDGYDDIFAFFVGKKGGDMKNIALIPGNSGDVVSIDNINLNKNSGYFVDNDKYGTNPPVTYEIEYDGFTYVLCARYSNIVPGDTYHIKLAIADTYDDGIDSAVLISAVTTEPLFLTITTDSLPSQQVGTAYSATLEAQGGASPYSWSIDGVTLSSGLTPGIEGSPSINPVTGEFTWVLPPVPQPEYIDITFKVVDEQGDKASAVFRYTDPDVIVSSSATQGGVGGGGGGGGGQMFYRYRCLR